MFQESNVQNRMRYWFAMKSQYESSGIVLDMLRASRHNSYHVYHRIPITGNLNH